jgi:hypothetical protein
MPSNHLPDPATLDEQYRLPKKAKARIDPEEERAHELAVERARGPAPRQQLDEPRLERALARYVALAERTRAAWLALSDANERYTAQRQSVSQLRGRLDDAKYASRQWPSDPAVRRFETEVARAEQELERLRELHRAASERYQASSRLIEPARRWLRDQGVDATRIPLPV